MNKPNQKHEKVLEMRIRDSVAFVTGANRGLGLAFVHELLAAGARKVYAASRFPERIAENPRVDRVRLNVYKSGTIDAIAQACRDVNLLINSAGVCYGPGFLACDAVEIARSEMETNYFGPLHLSRAFAPILNRNGGGAIVNVLSFLSWISIPGAGTYSASKSAAWSLTNWLRTGLREQRTQVIGVHPGLLGIEMVTQLMLPKINSVDVVRQVFIAIEAGRDEVLAGEIARQVKAGLSNEPGIYLNFEPRRVLANGRLSNTRRMSHETLENESSLQWAGDLQSGEII